MLFITLNDGTKQNLTTISHIERDKTDVLYKTAKGSLDNIVEHFETEQEAEDRITELEGLLL